MTNQWASFLFVLLFRMCVKRKVDEPFLQMQQVLAGARANDYDTIFLETVDNLRLWKMIVIRISWLLWKIWARGFSSWF
jgi:hypothetical protein